MQTPHFDLPFRFMHRGGAASVEQDSFEDITNCVECIVRTPYGFRVDAPEFGFPNLELFEQPVLSSDVIDLVDSQEPRASLILSENPDKLDSLIDRITVEVSPA